MSLNTEYEVIPIAPQKAHAMILTKHYAQRLPPISFAFGCYHEAELIGICSIGKPASPYLCREICGEENQHKVFELNRLVLTKSGPKNLLSWFLSRVLRYLKELDLILVSYADEGKGHFGFIYQATNWVYTGATKKRTDKYVPNGGHSRHYTSEYNYLRKVRTKKHRYVFFTGKSKKELLNKLKYSILDYPKGQNQSYILGEKLPDKIIDTRDNSVFYE